MVALSFESSFAFFITLFNGYGGEICATITPYILGKIRTNKTSNHTREQGKF